MYISRSVSLGMVWDAGDIAYCKMPDLSVEARTLYDQVHGPHRYDRFKEGEGTFHGGIPPPSGTTPEIPKDFYHKMEYDAESVFWSALSALLLVRPADEEESPECANAMKRMWKQLQSHTIEAIKPGTDYVDLTDPREQTFLRCRDRRYLSALLPCMRDVAYLLYNLSRQVAPSYPLMSIPPPRPDHLHEAMQRLILDYLVAHRDKDIPLAPTRLRATADDPPKDVPKPDTKSANSRKRTRDGEQAIGVRQSKRIATQRNSSLPVAAHTGFPYEFGHQP